MITLQHSICDLIKLNGSIKKFDKEVPFCLLPDSIRAYIGPRPLSHFEESPDKKDISWYKFPTDLKSMTKDSALSQEKHLSVINLKSCLGENSHIYKFIETNRNLPQLEFDGIMTHLIQDYIFDDWIRKIIDCSNKYEPDASFIFEGKEYDSNGIRTIIAEIEEYGFYILAYLCYKNYGAIINQKWFDENVFKALEREYPIDLADKTYKYMKIPSEMDKKISNMDWSLLKNSKYSRYNSEYIELYKKIIIYTQNFDLFFKECYGIYEYQ